VPKNFVSLSKKSSKKVTGHSPEENNLNKKDFIVRHPCTSKKCCAENNNASPDTNGEMGFYDDTNVIPG